MDDDLLAQQLRDWSTGWEPISTANPFVAPSGSTDLEPEPPDGSGVEPTAFVGPQAPDRSRPASPRPGARWPVRAAVVLLAVVLAAVAVRQLHNEPSSPAGQSLVDVRVEEELAGFRAGPCPVPEPRPTGLSAEEREAETSFQLALSDATHEESLRTGWSRFSTDDRKGGWMCGWVEVNRAGEPWEGLPVFVYGGGQELYDAPGGNLLGVGYPYLGFFTVEEVAAPGFDPIALRIEEFGCDPLVDAACQP